MPVQTKAIPQGHQQDIIQKAVLSRRQHCDASASSDSGSEEDVAPIMLNSVAVLKELAANRDRPCLPCPSTDAPCEDFVAYVQHDLDNENFCSTASLSTDKSRGDLHGIAQTMSSTQYLLPSSSKISSVTSNTSYSATVKSGMRSSTCSEEHLASRRVVEIATGKHI